jgi:hypothetical protein
LLKRDGMRIFLHGCVIALMAGCTGDLVEIGVGAKQDMSVGAAADMAQGGGGEMGPTTAKFSPDIQSDLDAKGCTITACHGTSGNGSVMYVKPMATAQADIDTNYMDVMAEINTTAPDQSKLVRFPLAGSGSGHAGTTPFANTSDPTYMKWLAWIQAGAPKQ